jgi:Imelysin
MTSATEVSVSMHRPALARRIALALALCALALSAAACGDDDSSDDSASTTERTARGADLAAIKDYLLEHTERLTRDTGKVRANAEEYYELAKSADFDYARLLQDNRPRVRRLVREAQRAFASANPSYEEMEGVVAGVPSLAEYDVIIDAGSDASDPENAVPFDLKTPGGRTFEQPGNFNFLIETAAFGTEPKFQAKGVKADLDGDGKVTFPEALPDADFVLAAATDFVKYAKELDASAKKWEPTLEDAFTAVVVMTPTMSEYFEAWKNSRFVAGNKAEEKSFVATSRLSDIRDILGGIVLIYANIQPSIDKVNAEQAKQTKVDLDNLHQFAGRLLSEEEGGKKFTASDADTLGSEAQRNAEAIAGQVSQAAGQLGLKLEN